MWVAGRGSLRDLVATCKRLHLQPPAVAVGAVATTHRTGDLHKVAPGLLLLHWTCGTSSVSRMAVSAVSTAASDCATGYNCQRLSATVPLAAAVSDCGIRCNCQ